MPTRRPSRIFTIAAALCLITAVSSGQQDGISPPVSPSPQHTFRTSVELVALNVTVLDGRRRFVQGLGREDFMVFENGVRQEIAFFGFGDVPVDLTLLLDLSGSMASSMELLRKAAVGFVRKLRPHDRATVQGFAKRLQILEPLTADIRQLEQAIERARPDGNTALYDAVYITLRQLQRQRHGSRDLRRQVVVVLSDGRDTASLVSDDDTLAAARRTGVTIYTVALRVADDNAFPSEADYTLRAMAHDSGGRAFSPADATQLGGIYDVIAAEIANHYVLAYVPSTSQGGDGFRHVSVSVGTRADAQARTRRGYYAAQER